MMTINNLRGWQKEVIICDCDKWSGENGGYEKIDFTPEFFSVLRIGIS